MLVVSNTVENKIPDTKDLMIFNVLHTKIRKTENKTSDHAKYSSTPEFNKSSS